jgi:uncharacterized membrane protein
MALKGDALFARVVEPYASPITSGSAIALLASIATGMMALTGVVFSLVLVVVQFGSTAYSPRLVGLLSRTGRIPHALGIFTGTFLYAGLAIHTVDIGGRPGVNQVVVWTAFGWLVLSVVALVVVVRDVQQLTIDRILGALAERGRVAIARVYPPLGARAAGLHARRTPSARPATQVFTYTGPLRYLGVLHVRSLVRLARRAGGTLVVPHAVGDPLVAGDTLALLYGAERPLPPWRVREAIDLGGRREVETDPSYALRLLVDVAIRALSPAVNDPTTAASALDEIEGLLRQLGTRDLDVGRVTDAEGTTRLVHETPTWEDLLSLALTEIQHYGRDSVQVERRLAALLENLAAAVPKARGPAVRRWSARHAATIGRAFDGDPERASEARAIDRQGLGHAQAKRPA